MPPIPPPQPLPPQTVSSYSIVLDADTSDSRPSTSYLMNHPNSSSFSSTVSTSSTIGSNDSFVFSVRPRTASASFSSRFEVGDASAKPRSFNRFLLDGSLSESEIAALPRSLFPLEQLEALSERSLAMHLYRSYQSVLACQEAMWEELKDRIINRKEELTPYGWDDDEELEELKNRNKFERLLERYKSDMQARIALWCSLTGIGWDFPARESLSKAELMEEERIRESLLEARRFVSDDERQVPCRSLRVLVGHKL
ncbi:hypothetical protein C0992_003976 [Termitomyces sp. T32_za158]|nr:hypothetical protein C0992_003976 [Termitomyces sp. T32_za158]